MNNKNSWRCQKGNFEDNLLPQTNINIFNEIIIRNGLWLWLFLPKWMYINFHWSFHAAFGAVKFHFLFLKYSKNKNQNIQFVSALFSIEHGFTGCTNFVYWFFVLAEMFLNDISNYKQSFMTVVFRMTWNNCFHLQSSVATSIWNRRNTWAYGIYGIITGQHNTFHFIFKICVQCEYRIWNWLL